MNSQKHRPQRSVFATLGPMINIKKTKNLFDDYHVDKPTLTELEKEEEIIGRGKATFIEVGEALARVKDKKLYERRYKTWAEYYERRWGFKKSYVYDLMNASEEALKLPEPERPKTEREARKSFKTRRLSAMADIPPQYKDVAKAMSKPEPAEEPRARRWREAMAKLRAAQDKDEEGFLETVEQMLENWGL
jgi:hypothetical protein